MPSHQTTASLPPVVWTRASESGSWPAETSLRDLRKLAVTLVTRIASTLSHSHPLVENSFPVVWTEPSECGNSKATTPTTKTCHQEILVEASVFALSRATRFVYRDKYCDSTTDICVQDFVLSVALSPDGEWVLSGSKDRGVQFWNPQTGDAQLMLQGHKNSVISVAPSPVQGGLFATGSGDMRARIWRFVPLHYHEKTLL